MINKTAITVVLQQQGGLGLNQETHFCKSVDNVLDCNKTSSILYPF